MIFCNASLAQSNLSLRCVFDVGTNANFQEKTVEAEKAKGSTLPPIIFDQIDTLSGTARMIGNAGAETVTALSRSNSIHLVELTASGNLNVTTVFNTNDSNSSFDYPVVHSRHIDLSGGPLPSQYYGFCKKLN